MRKACLAAAAASSLALAGGAADAQSPSLTTFFSTSKLAPLAQTATVLNLEAQMADGSGQQDVNTFNQFFLINGTGKLVVQFNGSLANQGQKVLPGWMGVAQFSNHTISSDIQAGWQAVKAKYSLTNAVGGVVIYKTLNTAQLVYDYRVQISPGSSTCQEYLYTPANSGFQMGVRTNCTWTLGGFPGAMKSSGGRSAMMKHKGAM
jgi:hypothetical protein